MCWCVSETPGQDFDNSLSSGRLVSTTVNLRQYSCGVLSGNFNPYAHCANVTMKQSVIPLNLRVSSYKNRYDPDGFSMLKYPPARTSKAQS